MMSILVEGDMHRNWAFHSEFQGIVKQVKEYLFEPLLVGKKNLRHWVITNIV
jgi:ABC-type xylose transport system substrate-binding protein